MKTHKLERFCGYCYNVRKSSHDQHQPKAIGEVEGIPACAHHFTKHSPNASAFRYTKPKKS